MRNKTSIFRRIFPQSAKPATDEKTATIEDVMGEAREIERKVFDAAPLGKQLIVHGVEMRVMHHRHYRPGYLGCVSSIPPVYSAVICEYRDNNGLIQEYEMRMSKSLVVLSLQQRDRL